MRVGSLTKCLSLNRVEQESGGWLRLRRGRGIARDRRRVVPPASARTAICMVVTIRHRPSGGARHCRNRRSTARLPAYPMIQRRNRTERRAAHAHDRTNVFTVMISSLWTQSLEAGSFLCFLPRQRCDRSALSDNDYKIISSYQLMQAKLATPTPWSDRFIMARDAAGWYCRHTR